MIEYRLGSFRHDFFDEKSWRNNCQGCFASVIYLSLIHIFTVWSGAKEYLSFFFDELFKPDLTYPEHVTCLLYTSRAFNCLKRAGVNTVADLINKSPDEMMKVRNLGKKSLEEVIWKLQSLGFDLSKDDDN